MPKGSVSYIICVEERFGEGGFWTVTSKNLPGLFLGGQDLGPIRHDLPEAIKALFKLNYEMDVEVRLLSAGPPVAGDGFAPSVQTPNMWTAIPMAA